MKILRLWQNKEAKAEADKLLIMMKTGPIATLTIITIATWLNCCLLVNKRETQKSLLQKSLLLLKKRGP